MNQCASYQVFQHRTLLQFGLILWNSLAQHKLQKSKPLNLSLLTNNACKKNLLYILYLMVLKNHIHKDYFYQ